MLCTVGLEAKPGDLKNALAAERQTMQIITFQQRHHQPMIGLSQFYGITFEKTPQSQLFLLLSSISFYVIKIKFRTSRELNARSINLE